MQGEQSDGSCRRQYYRLRYPTKLRPFVKINGTTFPVTELSEKGMRILVKNVTDLPSKVEGTLTLRGIEHVVRGDLLTVRSREAIVVNLIGITYPMMIAEQRLCLREFTYI